MNFRKISIAFLLFTVFGCTASDRSPVTSSAYPDVHIIGAMKNVMRKGDLSDRINPDTLSDKSHLYGLGPLTHLTGELLINEGKCYVSKVTPDSVGMSVTRDCAVSAPFFVYARVKEWEAVPLPAEVKSIADLEEFIETSTKDRKRPFAFKLYGIVNSAVIHIQNLPPGTRVSSPAEAHQGQVNYNLPKTAANIIGFFSTEHQGIFTHHDSYLHLHLITRDEQSMGHLDKAEFGDMILYLPKG